MLTTKEAIEKRRSVRKFKPVQIPDEYLSAILDSARLAPSGCNAQPWRFKIVKDSNTKTELARAAFNQTFIAEAPVVIVCCADIRGYIEGTISGTQDLCESGTVESRIVSILQDKAEFLKSVAQAEIAPRIATNVAIAIEHIVLRALDFGLGSCWVRLVEGPKINELFGWNDNIYVVALLPLGYPAEAPEARKRLSLQDIIIE
jgi:nitroreductase